MQTVAPWRVIVAFLIDLFGSFLVFTFTMAALTGDLETGDGRVSANLDNGPAWLVIFLVIAYFVVMNKWLGGTLGKKLLGIAGPKDGSPPQVKS